MLSRLASLLRYIHIHFHEDNIDYSRILDYNSVFDGIRRRFKRQDGLFERDFLPQITNNIFVNIKLQFIILSGTTKYKLSKKDKVR